MALGVFDMGKVVAVWNGITITGFAETGIAWERDEDSSTYQVGSTGDATLSIGRNRAGKVTFTLIQSAAANALLSAQMQLFENGAGGIGPLLVKDGSGSITPTVISAEKAWPVKPAGGEFGREASEREWVLQTDNLQVFVGSNS